MVVVVVVAAAEAAAAAVTTCLIVVFTTILASRYHLRLPIKISDVHTDEDKRSRSRGG